MSADYDAAFCRLPPLVSADAPIAVAIAHLGQGSSGGGPSGLLVKNDGPTLGWLTSQDVVAGLAGGLNLDRHRVGDVPCQRVQVIDETDLLDEPALLALAQQQPLCLVNQDNQPVGVVTYDSLLRHLGQGMLPCQERKDGRANADEGTGGTPPNSWPISPGVLAKQRDLSHLFVDITSRFVDIDHDQWDAEVNHTLAMVGAFMGVDHAYLAMFDLPWPQILDNATVSVPHTWYHPRIDHPTQPPAAIPLSGFPWAIGELLHRRPVVVPQVSALPPEQAVDRDGWQRFGMQAVVAVPLVQREGVVGFLGFASLRQAMPWETYTVQLLQVLAQTLANARSRLEIEQTLSLGQAQNQAILAAIPDLMFRVGADGVYRGYVTTNRTSDVLADVVNPVGYSIFDLLPADLAQRQFGYLQQALTTGRLQVYEQRLAFGDALHDEEVRVVKSGEDEVLFMVRDISDRKSMERQLHDLNQSLEQKVADRTAALRARESQIRAIVTAIPDTLVRVNRTGDCVDCLPSLMVGPAAADSDGRIHGMISDPVDAIALGKPATPPGQGAATPHGAMADAPHGPTRTACDDLKRMVEPQPEALERAIATGEVQVYEQQIDQGDQTFYQEVRIAAISDQEALLMVRDVTGRKQAELNLQANEAKFRRLAENIPAAIFRYWMYPDGRDQFTYLSPYVETIYGVSPEMALADSKALFSRVHPDDILPLMSAIQASATKLMPFYSEHRISALDGTPKWVQVSSSPEVQPNGDLLWQGVILDISDRKRAELDRQVVLQELSAFKLALDASAMVSIADRRGVITYVNDCFIEVSGYSREELVGRTHEVINSGYHSRYFFQDLWHTLLLGQVWRGEICNRAKDGQLFWMDSTIVPFLDEHSRPVRFLAVRFDITARKQAELALRSSNALLSTISEAQAQFITAANRLDIFDDLLRRLLDLTNSEYALLGEMLEDPDTGHQLGESFLKVKGMPHLRTYCGQASHAGRPSPEAALAPDLFPTLQTLVDRVVVTGASVSLQAPIALANGILLDSFLGLPILQGETLVGVVAMANCPHGYDEDVVDYLEPFVVTCSNLIQGYRLERKRRATEERLNQTNEELARATRLKDEFLANMSHELRTPLNAILGMAEGLQEEIFGSINDRQIKALRTIEHSGAHLLELINDILDVAKIESGQVELDLAAVAVAPLCRSSLTFVKQQALKKRITINTDWPNSLPCLWGDERRLRQVLINLLANAVKFTPDGGQISLSVSVLDSLTGGTWGGAQGGSRERLRIAVTDTGIGIAPEDAATLFQPFIQIDSTLNRQYQGTGLGLALVKRIVELHQGAVGLTSEPGGGSCFTVDLPTVAPSSPSAPATPSLLGGPPVAMGATSSLILLAEDNQASISTLSSYLGAKGFRLVVAHNGPEALALAQATSPNLILMDIQMPGMDGLVVMEQMRQIPNLATVPIIALTALATTLDRDRCLAAGATDYLSKPVRLKDLAYKIQTLLDQGRVTP